MADRLAIQDLMATYAQGVDRRDWEAVRATFHPDATDDHGDCKGGVDGFIEWVSRRHAGIEQSMHFLGNCRIEFAAADRAVVETYYFVRQRSPGDVLLGGDTASVDVDVEISGAISISSRNATAPLAHGAPHRRLRRHAPLAVARQPDSRWLGPG